MFNRSKLLAAREDRGQSVDQAAHELGVAVSTWYAWENGRRTPTAGLLRRAVEKYIVDARK